MTSKSILNSEFLTERRQISNGDRIRHDSFLQREVHGNGAACLATWPADYVISVLESGGLHVCLLVPDHAKTSTATDPNEHFCECGFRWVGNTNVEQVVIK